MINFSQCNEPLMRHGVYPRSCELEKSDTSVKGYGNTEGLNCICIVYPFAMCAEILLYWASEIANVFELGTYLMISAFTFFKYVLL